MASSFTEPGILVIAHTRPSHLAAVLESLRRQNATRFVQLWIDGHQSKQRYIRSVTECQEVAAQYPEVSLTALNGNLGIDKLMLDALSSMCSRFEEIIVLEDDCFPTANAIASFSSALAGIRDLPEMFSVYGHHFLVPGEDDFFPRFQGWGWATWSHKLIPLLSQAKQCLAMSEPEYIRWVAPLLTDDVRARLSATPGRYPPAEHYFSWDALFAALTASRRLCHRRTPTRVIFNCGIGKDGMRFPYADKFRRPPFNMISVEEVWDHFE
ncbi:MAG: hypothetical protein JJE04_19465 [Acidobacteriia bacterium]|nr:hypothetical protein [Terriglobia bacterium]